jgi:leucyl aminopeptidase
VAEGVLLAAYSYTAQKSSPKAATLTDVTIVSSAPTAAAGTARGVVIANAQCAARDLINEPAGSMTPSRLAEWATTRRGLSVTVLDEVDILAAGLGGLAGVAQVSEAAPRLIELLYEPKGANADTPTLGLIGKGITFDSGGLSLKTGTGMMTMKTDMSGAAAVISAMVAIAAVGAPVRVLGLCPTTENMPSGTAIRPGDVLKIRNGKTVEVLNTDAEGRLVLADGLSLAVEAGVDAMVDIATLTGAVSTALGRRIAGLMGSDDIWTQSVRAAATRAGESAWILPLPDEYRSEIDSEVADIKNIGTSGTAGTIVAGLFLKEFVGSVPWAHLDMAGTARSESDEGFTTKGGTGWGVRTLVELATSGAIPTREGATRRARWKGKTPAAQLRRPADRAPLDPPTVDSPAE